MHYEKLPLLSSAPILSLAYSSELRMLAVGQMRDSSNPNLSIWDFSKRKSVQVINANEGANVAAMSFDYTGKRLIYSDNDNLFTFEISSNQRHKIDINNTKINKIISSKLTPRIIVSGLRPEVVDIDSGRSLWNMQEYEAMTISRDLKIESLPSDWSNSKESYSFVNEPAAIEIYDDGERILIGGHNKGKIELIEISSGRVLRELFPAPIQANLMSLGCNETILAVSSKIPYANFLWDIESGKRISPDHFNERLGGCSTLCVHTTRRLIASGSLIGYVSLQNIDSGKFIFSERLHNAGVSQVIFSEKENIIFSGGDDGEVKVSEFDI